MSQTKADKIIDGRGLEPPQPLVLTLDALDTIGPHEKLLLILSREPYPLYRTLQLNGFAHKTEHTPEGTVEILMWRNRP